MSPKVDWPEDVPGAVFFPARWYGPQKKKPIGVVLHSNDTDSDLTKYLKDPPDGRKVSYHLVIDRFRKRTEQLVSLRARAYHAGREGNDFIGVALRGPHTLDPRPDWERGELTRILALLRRLLGIQFWCRHSDLTDQRKDPGPGVLDAWPEEAGLTWGKPDSI